MLQFKKYIKSNWFIFQQILDWLSDVLRTAMSVITLVRMIISLV